MPGDDGTDAAKRVQGSFGPAELVLTFPVSRLAAMYQASFGFDALPAFAGLKDLQLYRCEATGMEFWRPEKVAGNEDFYKRISVAARHYYQEWRWEYDLVLPYANAARILEIGCGRGFFLRATEGVAEFAQGIEFNREAIANKVTQWPVEPNTIEMLAATEGSSFDLVCSFQVLEHVVDPSSFIRGAMLAVKPGGILAFSVPNQEHRPFRHRSDPLDFPPHHMNQFTGESLRRIADFLNLELLALRTQVRRYDFDPLSPGSLRQSTKHLLRNAAKWTMNQVYSVTKEPGHTMLGIFKRKTESL